MTSTAPKPAEQAPDCEASQPTPAKRPLNADIGAAIALLAEAFPFAFAVYERRRKPLKIGIHVDIAKRCTAMSASEISAALGAYCANGGYLAAVARREKRVDLAGNPAGDVTVGEAESARARLIKRQAAKVLGVDHKTSQNDLANKSPKAGEKVATGSAATKAGDGLRNNSSKSEESVRTGGAATKAGDGLATLKAAALRRKTADNGNGDVWGPLGAALDPVASRERKGR